MKKLAIDAIFTDIKKDFRSPAFYYKHFLKLGEIEYSPVPKINLEKAVMKIYSIDSKAGTMAEKLLDSMGDFDIKNFFHHIEYRQGKFTNYVVSEPLLKVLSNIKVDMPCSSLPDNIRAYFDLGGFMGIQYFLITTYVKPNGQRQIKMTVCEESVFKDSICFGVDLGESSLEDSIMSMPYSEMVYNEETKKYERVQMPVTGRTLKTINLAANLLIYISNPNEEFKTQYNEFSKDNKKAQKEKLEYTSRPYIVLGNGPEFLRLVVEESVDVSGHFRWQPCGVGRTQRKLTFIKPHVRNYKKFREVGND